MSDNRVHPWLTNHVIFFAYRWLAWAATGVLLLLTGRLQYVPLLAVLALINLLSTLTAQRYVRVALRNPLLVGAEIVLMVLLLTATGGWMSPFTMYAYSSLILPGLLHGWRGRTMAGLSFAAIYPAVLWAAGAPPSEFLAENGWPSLIRHLLSPVVFACMVPTALDLLRRAVAAGGRRRHQALPPRLDRSLSDDALRFIAPDRGPRRARSLFADDTPLALQATKVRATEQSVEELRRTIFMPLPTANMDLGAALDVLVVRFGQHTGIPARVTLLGRTRRLNPLHASLLVRLAQESLLNIQQHAHAASATLTLRYDPQNVALLIQDDGVGLLDGTYERPGLHALRAMQYRVAEFGGRLDVFETEGGGVTVRAAMPLE